MHVKKGKYATILAKVQLSSDSIFRENETVKLALGTFIASCLISFCRMTYWYFFFFLFSRDPTAPVRSGKSMSENEIIASLPTESTDKTGRLLDLAMDSASNFFGSHQLNVKFPEETTQELARAFEEGKFNLS